MKLRSTALYFRRCVYSLYTDHHALALRTFNRAVPIFYAQSFVGLMSALLTVELVKGHSVSICNGLSEIRNMLVLADKPSAALWIHTL